jgi:hypothetical protein
MNLALLLIHLNSYIRAEPELDAIVTTHYYKLRLSCFCMKEDHTLSGHRGVCDMQLFFSIFVTFL